MVTVYLQSKAENDYLYHSNGILANFSFSSQDTNPENSHPHPGYIFLVRSILSENVLRDILKLFFLVYIKYNQIYKKHWPSQLYALTTCCQNASLLSITLYQTSESLMFIS